MTAVWMRARHDLESRWRGAVILALLFGVASGVAMTAAAGARRTETAFERLLRVSKAYDVEVQIQDDTSITILDEVARLPEVEQHARIAFVPGTDATRYSPDEPFRWDVTTAAIVDDALGKTFELPKILQGRLPDYDNPAEAIVNERFLAANKARVGDTFSLQLAGFDELLALFEGRPVPTTAPVARVRIVGVWRIPHDVTIGEQGGVLFLTPAFVRSYQERVALLFGMFVRLHRGDADVPAFVRAAKRLGAEETLAFRTSENTNAAVARSLGVQSDALWILAGAVAVAASLILGQALGRWLTLGADDHPILRSMGMSRRHRLGVIAIPALVIAAGAAAVAATAAAGFSRFVPVGFARSIEPDPGFFFDGTVVAAGLAATIGVISGWALIHGWALTRLRAVSDAAPQARPSAAAELASRGGMPPAVVTGIRFGLEPGRGRTAVPVRSVLTTTILSIVAVTGAFVFARNLNDILTTPASYGWNWDLVASGGEGDPDYVAEVESKLRASPHVAAFSRAKIATTTWRGRDLETLGVQQRQGDVAPVVLEGRYPMRSDEVALATRTLREEGLDIGERVIFPGSPSVCGDGRDCDVTFTIVGRVVHWGEGSDPDDGAALTMEGQERIRNSEGFDDFLVRIRPGADREVAFRDIREGVADTIDDPKLPTSLGNIKRVRTMPAILVAVLAILAVAALIHALVTVSRRRRHDLAILKTMGFLRRQVMAAMAWQATALVVTALVIGVPAGLVAGRWVWRSIADGLGVATVASFPIASLGLTIVATLLLANVVAVFPGRAAARTKPALVLRTE